MSEKRFIRQRKYEGSSDWLGAIGLATVFTIVGILGVVFWFANIEFIGLRSWGYYMFIPAFFIYIAGISTYLRQKRLRQEVLAALDSYQNMSVNIETLTQDLMMARPDLLRLLIDLRTERLIKFRVDAKSGDVILGESFTPPPVESPVTPATPTETVYCPQCGIRMPADSIFCPNCGASM